MHLPKTQRSLKLAVTAFTILTMFLVISACSKEESKIAIIPDIPAGKSATIDVGKKVTSLVAENKLVTTALGDNLLVNPSFEQGLSGWSSCEGATSFTISSDSISGNAATLATGCYYQTVATTPDTELSLSCQMKVNDATGWAGTGFGFADSNFANLLQAPELTLTGSSYREYSTTATAPANTQYASVWAYTDGSINIDDCVLAAGTPPAPEGNLLNNPSFTTQADWFNCGTASNWNIAAGDLNMNNTACVYQTINGTAALEYTLSCTSKSDGQSFTEIILSALDVNYAAIEQKVAVIETTTFQANQATLTAPSATKYMAATFYGEGPTTHQECSLSVGGDVTPPDPQAPTVAITAPSNGATLANGANLFVTATASDSDGTVANVKLFLNNQLVAQDNTAPYEWNSQNQLQNLAEGSYTLRAEATDNTGLTASSTTTIQVEAAPTATGSGLYGEYYDTINFSGPKFERLDRTINFNWGQGSPAPGIGQDTSSIRWTGEIQPKFSGLYTFYATADDGVRLRINNQLIIDKWIDKAATEHVGTINLEANQKYPFNMEFFENGGFASIKLEWSSSQQTREVVPTSQLYPAQTVVSEAGSKGEWGGVQSWPLIATHMANLKDGRVLAWSSYDANGFGGQPNANRTKATIFNPLDNTFQAVDNPTHDMFCAGLVTLSDGTILAAGGGDGNTSRSKVSTFNGSSWTRLPAMPNPHWYGTAVVDASDNVTVAIGASSNFKTDHLSNASATGAGSVWKNLPNINLEGTREAGLETPDWYPYLHLSPRGTIFHSGATTQMHEISTAGNGTTTAKGSRNSTGVTGEVYRQWGSAIMIDEGKIMMTGGTPKQTTPGSLNTGVIIDINTTTPQVSRIAPMQFTRSYQSTILLPNGEVLILGGNGTGVEFNDEQSRLIPEVYTPSTNTWRNLSPMSVPRNYHSTATLLQDGRVLAAGGGLCRCSADHQDGQIFSPPYLFNADGTAAARPSITTAPANIGYNQSFTVNVTGAGAANMSRFVMIKFSANTHAMNTDLRQDVLEFSNQGNGAYSLTSGSNNNVVTPGPYYLFAVNAAGVPSVASIIQIN